MTGRVYPTIGVDPGQRWVGLAARIDGACLDAATLDRGRAPAKGEERYLGGAQVAFADLFLDHLAVMMERNRPAAVAAAAGWDVPDGTHPWRVAAEGIVVTGAYIKGRYNPGHRIAKLASLVEVALVLGMLMGQYPGLVVVRPRRFGNPTDPRHGDVLAKLGPYPKELRRRRPPEFMVNEHDRGDRIHERSAWAVAGAAQLARPLTPTSSGVLAG
jgi:hypothetical protein